MPERFGNIPIENHSPKPKEEFRNDEKSTSLHTRREIIKKGLQGIVALGAIAYGIDKFAGDQAEKTSAKEKLDPSSELDEIRLNLRLETLEQARIRELDNEVAGRTLENQIETKGRITLDGATRQALYANWRKEYAPGGYNYRHGIVEGLERMKPWMGDIKEIFQKHGIPEKLMFLAFAESNFRLKAVSDKSAVGPYQIMSATAKKYGLIVSNNYDERLDPLKSADLCAKYLKDSYERYGKDWDLALMDYNGGFTNDYIEYVKNREKNEPLQITGLDIVNQGDTFENLAKKHGTSVTLLMRANPKIKKPSDLQADSYIKIPHKRSVSLGDFKAWLETEANKKIKKAKEDGKDPKKAIEEFSENINYPEKFYAIYDIIEEQGLISDSGGSEKRKALITIQKGATLEYIGKLKGIALKRLIDKNPAVTNPKGNLPPGATIFA